MATEEEFYSQLDEKMSLMDRYLPYKIREKRRNLGDFPYDKVEKPIGMDYKEDN